MKKQPLFLPGKSVEKIALFVALSGHSIASVHRSQFQLFEEAMRNRPCIQKRLFRHALRKQISRASQNERDMIQVSLADEAVFATVYEEAMNRASYVASAQGQFTISINDEGAPVVDNLLKLFTWFVENGPELIRIIELAVGLFGSANAAAIICEME